MLAEFLKSIRTRPAILAIVAVNSVLWSWLWIVNLAHLSDQKLPAYVTIFFAYTIIVAICSVVHLKAYYYLRKAYKKQNPTVWLLRAVATWAFAEAFIAWAVAFVWMGKNGSLDNVFPFSSLTPFVMYTPLRFLTRFVGYYGLSAITLIGITALFLKKIRKHALIYWLAVIVLTIAAWSVYKQPNGSPLKATVVAETLENKVPVAAQDSQLVVLPEYGLDNLEDKGNQLRFQSTSNNYYYVGSRQTVVKNGHTNNLIFGSKQLGEVAEQPKNRLIAGGEYLPYGVDLFTELLAPTTHSDFMVRREVVRGSKPIHPYKISSQLVVGAGVCSSIMTPRDYRLLTKQGSTVLTNSASLEIFEGSRLFGWQHRGLATFMAVANARPFLQSTNHWPAFILDQNGHKLAEVMPNGQVTESIKPTSMKTPYTLLGEWVAVLGGCLLLLEAYKEKTRKKA